MEYVICGAAVYQSGKLEKLDLKIKDGQIAEIGQNLQAAKMVDAAGLLVAPGFIDIHVHLREPGFDYKETIESGTMAAAHGGFTTVCAMPNLNPVPDSREHLAVSERRIAESAKVHVLPYASITVGEKGQQLSEIEALAPRCPGFTDDGKGVQSEEMMREAMRRVKACGSLLCAHCEDESLLHGGYIHDGAYAKAHGHRGICSRSEYGQIERDVKLAAETGCRYHVCHVSAKESVEILRRAKQTAQNISFEITPHHLLLCEDDITEDDGRFKMNPPLRAAEDRRALVEALIDGTCDCIATDHAPHSAEEKARGLEKSAMGTVGIESAFGVLYHGLVKTGRLPLERLLYLLTEGPAKVLGIDYGIRAGAPADLVMLDLTKEYRICSDEFLSKGRSTPFEGKEAAGKTVRTLVGGKVIYGEEF
ncbi:dihydroorotase [Acidaminobacterium chupaoyuni]